MLLKKLLLIIPTFFLLALRGQNNPCLYFRTLDIAANNVSAKRELVTEKIIFSNDNNLDIKKSKPTLDSIRWFLTGHPKAIVSITLLKYTADSTNKAEFQTGQQQSKQIVKYLTKKGINQKRILALVSYIRPETNYNLNIKTRIRVISNDFSDNSIR